MPEKLPTTSGEITCGYRDMAKYRSKLPQLSEKLFLTDGGLETTLIYHHGVDLPHFAAFDLLHRRGGPEELRRYYAQYAATAKEAKVGFIFESPTWRASSDWGARLGHSGAELADLNRRAIGLMVELRAAFETDASPMVISGCVGPRGDGYRPGHLMSAEEAERYHSRQTGIFAGTEADMVTAITINYVAEAVGIVRAAQAAGMPVAISFTVETDGRLPTGETLEEAVEAVDAATGAGPAYYMVNCAHPAHFESALASSKPWSRRLRGIRANASTCSHAELDSMTTLDDGDPADLGRRYAALLRTLPNVNVLGGCCGTDHRHIHAIWQACRHAPSFADAA